MEKAGFLIAGVILGNALCARVCPGAGVAVPDEALGQAAPSFLETRVALVLPNVLPFG